MSRKLVGVSVFGFCLILGCADEYPSDYFAPLGSNLESVAKEVEDVSFFDFEGVVTDSRLLVQDSFEGRTEVAGPDFSWRRAIDDQGKFADNYDASRSNIDSLILGSIPKYQVGPAFHEQNSLYFHGRTGSSIHVLYLATRRFDLSPYNRLKFSFSYLTFGLNDLREVNRGEPEYLRVDVCRNSANSCGVGDSLVAAGMKDSSKWKVLFEAMPDRFGSEYVLNATNHSVEDWQSYESPEIDLTQYPNRDEFVLRFSVRLSDGFISGSSRMDDGVALDWVVVEAAQVQ